jgi:hypothetical protein
MGEVFEKDAVGREQFFEHGLAVMLGAAPEDVVMGAGDGLDCVELDIAELFDNGEQVGFACRRMREGLRVKPKAAGVFVRYA